MSTIGRRLLTYVLTISAPMALGVSAAWSAAADPQDSPLIATTCSYAQLEAALEVEAPKFAAELAQRPSAQAKLQAFLELPVDQRKQRVTEALDRKPEWRSIIEEKRNTPEGQQKVARLGRIADTCHGY